MLNEKQLVWRCRRGVRELDVLLARFLETQYSELKLQERQAFERLLEEQDPIIMDWLFSKYLSDDEGIVAIVDRLQNLSGINK